MMATYADFLAAKALVDFPTGIADPAGLDDTKLFPFQRDVTRWALRRGRAAIFADCGLGKTPMQLEWARNVIADSGGTVLVLTPLAVAQQTVREAEKFGIEASYAREPDDIRHSITVTNYDRLDHFDPTQFAGVVLDESSILKAFDGATRTQLIETFQRTPFRLACTATPAPNDYMELGNHAEFLGVLTRTEMLATFFCHDGGETQKWRLKGHAQRDFWRWLTSWAVMLRKPSDLGYSDDGFTLPPMTITQHTVEAEASDGELFAIEAQTLQERLAARRASLNERVAEAAPPRVSPAETTASTDRLAVIWRIYRDGSRISKGNVEWLLNEVTELRASLADGWIIIDKLSEAKLALTIENEALRASLASAQRDTDDMDWIEANGLPDEKVYDGLSLRQAVAAARVPPSDESGAQP